MIHLIMVLSTIMLPSCMTMNSSLQAIDAHLANPSTNQRPSDDIKEDGFADGMSKQPPLLVLQMQLQPTTDLILPSNSPSFNIKNKSKPSKLPSKSIVRGIPLTKASRRRRIYLQGQGNTGDDNNTDENWMTYLPKDSVLSIPVHLPSVKACSESPCKLRWSSRRAIPKRKQITLKSHTRNHDRTAKHLFRDLIKEERGSWSDVKYNETHSNDSAKKYYQNDEPYSVDSYLKVQLLVDDEINRKKNEVNNRTTKYISDISDRERRSVSSEQTNQEANARDVDGDNSSLMTKRHGSKNKNDTDAVNVSPSSNHGSSTSNSTNTSRRGKRRRRGRRRHRQSKDLSLWIDERQVKLFSGYIMEIYVIHNGRVLPYILDPNFEKHLPIIPFEVQSVNFTWQAGRKRYYYTFDRLFSHDLTILHAPIVSLPTQGRIPRKPKVFTVNINCTGNASGIALFDIGLLIETRRGRPMPGTPLRLKLRKECTQPSPDPECDEKCENGGVCDAGRRCQCPEGYMGQFCNTALCYPQCMNGGTCATPGRCTCPSGYQGRHCEGGICRDKCENGGKCIQKDTCACPRGYYGNRCEFSKCVIPCINGGRCRNVNKCRCPAGFAGDHCEVVTGGNRETTAIARCSRKCRHGTCRGMTCECEQGFTGRWCKRRGSNRKRVWL